MGVNPKIGVPWGTPKWMVKIMENPTKMDDLGGFPIFWFNTHMIHEQKNNMFGEMSSPNLGVPIIGSQGFGMFGRMQLTVTNDPLRISREAFLDIPWSLPGYPLRPSWKSPCWRGGLWQKFDKNMTKSYPYLAKGPWNKSLNLNFS